MNIIKLWYPTMMNRFGHDVERLIAAHRDQAPGLDMALLRKRAGQGDYVVLALTDDRYRVIAVGCMKLGATASSNVIEAAVVDPDHGQSGDVRVDIRRNLADRAEERRFFSI